MNENTNKSKKTHRSDKLRKIQQNAYAHWYLSHDRLIGSVSGREEPMQIMESYYREW